MKKIITNKYFTFFAILALFFLGSLFQLIPIYILKLNINNITDRQQIPLTLFSNTISCLILIGIFYKDIKLDCKNFKKNFINIFETSFQIWVVGLLLMAFSNIIINSFSPDKIANNEEAIRSLIGVSPFLMLLTTAVTAPIVEELVFRKSFRMIFKNNIAFVLISGIVFGALHVITSITTTFDYLYLIPYCSLGIAFSYMYYKTDNICAPIFMHFIHNFIMTALNIFALGMIF